MMERIAEASPRLKARIAGILYLIAGSAGGSPRSSFAAGFLYVATPRLQPPTSWRTSRCTVWVALLISSVSRAIRPWRLSSTTCSSR